MTTHRNKFLERLKNENSKGVQGRNPQNPQKYYGEEHRAIFEGFEGSQVGSFSEISLPLDGAGVPCGVCPKCNLGEFWQWPKSHPDYDPTDWRCLRCRRIPLGAGPCMTFCGIPDGKERDYPSTDGPICAHCGRQDEPGNTVWTVRAYGVPLHTGCEAERMKKPGETQ
jgi:hypothetical protein